MNELNVTPSWKEWELLCDTDNRQQQSISRDETSMSGEHLAIVDLETEESMSNEIYDDKTCLNSIPTKLDNLLPSARFNETNEPSVEDEQTNSSTYNLKSCSRLTGPLVILLVLAVIFLILGREYLVQTLTWLEQLRLIPSICVFVALFTIVSFPFGFGYIILNMAAGYLYGLVRGQVVVTLSVAIGFTIAFVVCRCCLKNWAMQYVSKSTALLAMKSIVEGPHGIRVIVFTRFTPIPFGLQNTLFAVSYMDSDDSAFRVTFDILRVH